MSSRSSGELTSPGGGGINVARVFARLGTNVRAIWLSGGPTGAALHPGTELAHPDDIAAMAARV